MARLLVSLALLSFILLTLASGCTQANFTNPGEVPGGVNVALSKVDAEWSFGLGCYWTADGYVYNSGTQAVDNVQAHVTLIDRTTMAIQDSRSVAVGRLEPGESRSFAVKLDGECGGEYRVAVQVTGSK
jgi:hypothetical protein